MTRVHRLFLNWARTIHVYLTMFAFGVMLLFAITGFMLNHEDWFLPPSSFSGKIPQELLQPAVDRDGLVEHLRRDFGAVGDAVGFEQTQDALRIRFEGEDGKGEAVVALSDASATMTFDSGKSRERVVVVEGTMPLDLLVPDDKSKELPIVERLRKHFDARGEVNSPPRYEKESESFGVVFRSPGYLATATIRASDGHTRVTHQMRGINGILLDLHRGKDSGFAWSLVVDGVALIFVIVSVTGFVLWSSLRGRAQHGLGFLILGVAICVGIYFVFVPH